MEERYFLDLYLYLGYLLLQYSIQMEEIVPGFHKKQSEGHRPINSAHKASPKQATSLPNMPSLKTLQQSQRQCLQNPFILLEENYSLSIHEMEEFDKLSKETIYKKVYDFIMENVNNPSQHFDILRRFEQIETQLKTRLKKSIKVLPTKRKVLLSKKNSLNELELLCCSEQPQRKPKKIHFRDNNQQSISIKLINSRKNDLSMASLKENISMSKLLAYKDKIVLEEIQSAQNLDTHTQIQSVKGNHSRESNDQRQSYSSHEDAERTSFRQISIVMFEDNEDKESQIFSDESHTSLKDLDLPKLKLSEKLIEEIFDSPSPFLVNLSLCLLFKFFMKSKFQPEANQIGWLLGVSTLVAYKLFVDETIQGLAQYYCKVLKIKSEDLLFLQRWFLSGLNYQVVISNEHYLEMLLMLSKDAIA